MPEASDRHDHRHPFVRQVDSDLAHRCRIEPGSRLLLAVSGGADSVALLRALHQIAGRKHWGLDLQVCHVHHHLRSEADTDRDLVRQLTGQLHVPHHDIDIHVEPGNLEAQARRLRYAAMSDLAVKIDADAIALGHHADDQLETMLMRLMRGSGVRGLSAMAPRRRRRDLAVPLIRPMLRCTHDQALQYLDDLKQAWCEDTMNAEQHRWRACLRHQVLPVLRTLRPDVSLAAVRCADALAEADSALRTAAQQHWARLVEVHADGRITLTRDGLRTASREQAGRLLRRAARRCGVPADRLSRSTLAPILKAIQMTSGAEYQFDLARGIRVAITGSQIRIGRCASPEIAR